MIAINKEEKHEYHKQSYNNSGRDCATISSVAKAINKVTIIVGVTVATISSVAKAQDYLVTRLGCKVNKPL